MARPIPCVVACLLAVLGLTSSAAAQPSPEPSPATSTASPAPERPPPGSAAPITFSLALTAVGCTTTDAQLAAAISTRAPAAVRVEAAAEVAIRAEISSAAPSSLTVSLAQGSSRREFPGASCDEAVALIAFISSLVLDARPEERLKATELAAVPVRADAVAPPQSETPSPTKPQPAPPAPPSAATQSAASGEGGKPQVGAHAALALETAVAHTPPFGGLFGLNVRWERPSPLAPELRAELLVTGNAKQQANPSYPGEISLGLTAGRLSACPVRLPALKGAFLLGLCATLDGGRLHARGSSDISGRSQGMLWLAGGVAVLAEVPLGQSLELEFLAGLKRLVRHDLFTLEADPPGSGAPLAAYQVPAFSGSFALGVRLRP